MPGLLQISYNCFEQVLPIVAVLDFSKLVPQLDNAFRMRAPSTVVLPEADGAAPELMLKCFEDVVRCGLAVGLLELKVVHALELVAKGCDARAIIKPSKQRQDEVSPIAHEVLNLIEDEVSQRLDDVRYLIGFFEQTRRPANARAETALGLDASIM
jgi:hypothetical protein